MNRYILDKNIFFISVHYQSFLAQTETPRSIWMSDSSNDLLLFAIVGIQLSKQCFLKFISELFSAFLLCLFKINRLKSNKAKTYRMPFYFDFWQSNCQMSAIHHIANIQNALTYHHKPFHKLFRLTLKIIESNITNRSWIQRFWLPREMDISSRKTVQQPITFSGTKKHLVQ